MKLVSLHLENIKSYVRETITFYEGVNFISGPNGAGKSTIIEAIGYALFDANPFSAVRQFIREGEKSGLISVVFEGKDERLYRVERRLRHPSGGSWTVYDAEAGNELPELHGSQDVKSWLAENLGLAPDLDPCMLFEDVIGVSQGRFTAPFLERGARRKDIFNAILQLDTYRQAFERSSRLTGVFGQRLAEVTGARDRLLDKTGDLEQCRQDLQDAKDRQAEMSREISLLSEQLADIEKNIALQENLRQQLDNEEKKLQENKICLENLKANEIRLRQELEAAGTARQKLSAAEPGYRQFLELQTELKTIEAKSKERDNYLQGYQAVVNSATALEAEIKSDLENKKKQVALYETERNELLQAGKEAAAMMDEQSRILAEKREKWKDYEECKTPVLQLEAVLHRFRMKEHLGKSLEENLGVVREEINRLREELSPWEQVKVRAQEGPALEKELALVQEELGNVRARLKTLQENLRYAAGGLCPFFQTACSNVEGSLEEYFRKEISVLSPRLENQQAVKDRLESELEIVRQAQKEMQTLQLKKEQLARLESKEAELEGLLREQKDAVLREFDPSVVRSLTACWGKAAEILSSLGDFRELQKWLDQEKGHLEALVRDYENSYQGLTEEGRSPSSGDIVSLVAQLENIRDKGSALNSQIEKSVQVHLEDEGRQIAVLEARVRDLRERYRKVCCLLSELEKETETARKQEKLQLLQNQARQFRELLAGFEGLDRRREEVQASLQLHEEDYRQYLQNQGPAAREKGLAEELKMLEEEKGKLLQKIARLEDTVKSLQMACRPEELARLRTTRDGLKENQGRLKAELDLVARELQQLEGLIREKEKALEQVRALEKKIAGLEGARDLLQKMRSVLNQSGDRIAQVYRDFLGREAAFLYQQVAKENVYLTWGEDYEIIIRDTLEGKERERSFNQLSGGEKMTAALAVRLALLKYLSALGIGFFDEPTANLDEGRRTNLARIIPEITANFRQVFVISHDDTFDALTENVINLRKETGKGSFVAG